MNFEGKVEGYSATVCLWGSKTEIRVDGVGTFETLEKAEAAVRAYDLSLRKDFTNRTAWTITGRWGRQREIAEVQVTSVIDDKEAWIKNAKGERSKAQRNDLFANRSQVEAAMAVDAECEKHRETAWASATRWQPTK